MKGVEVTLNMQEIGRNNWYTERSTVGGTPVLAGELTLSCARPAADG